ncbi:MAG: sugar phosphate isomerase/epimerase, partial [Gammaproteobacteria bacterium]|nr:sugar phosphate isomerase/epimerase [Gammaproteobacteria bacterium]
MTLFAHTHIGVSTNLLNNPRNILGAVSKLSQNFQVIEVELENGTKDLLDGDSGTYNTIVRALAEFRQTNNLRFSVHAPYKGPLCNLAAADADARRNSCNRLRQAIQYCADIGGVRVTYHPGHINSLPMHQLMENLRRSLDELVPEAEDKQVTLCLENMGAERSISIVFSPEQHIELCQQTGTQLTLDIVHLASHFWAGEKFFQSFKAMLPYIGNIHLADTPVP